ncbi:MAG: Eco57I restriction-modification methylase domain-containing protein [Synergistaceae bacterium]
MSQEKILDAQAVRSVYEKFSIDLPNIGNLQNVFTPYSLCKDMIGRLKKYKRKFEGANFSVFNLEFAEVLMYDYGVKANQIWFFTDCVEKSKFAQLNRYAGLNVELVNLSRFLREKITMKFDVVIMNPPYQAPKAKEHEGRGKCGTSLWEDFVRKSFELAKDDGYVCAIHPNRWRRPEGKIGELIKSKQIHYLEMHGLEDGRKTFSCQTDYDWYIAQNKKSETNTQVVDYDGESNSIDLKNAPFIPNSNVKDVLSLVAKEGEEKVNLLWNCEYHTQARAKDGTMSPIQTDEFKYPCVYSVTIKGEVKFWYSSKKEQFFGIPKVICCNGHTMPIVDKNGEYGLTQFAFGIADKKTNLEKIQNVMNSDEFRKTIMGYRDNGGNVYDKNMIATFRKDFWNEI